MSESSSNATGRMALASVIFVAATLLALWQYLLPYSWHDPYTVVSPQWFANPLEQNIDAKLPEIRRSIHAITESANGKCVWIAGDDAFLAYSADGGRRWNALTYEKATGNLHADASAAEFPCADRSSS